MADKFKKTASLFPAVQKLDVESYRRLVASCENPPKPTKALRRLMNPPPQSKDMAGRRHSRNRD